MTTETAPSGPPPEPGPAAEGDPFSASEHAATSDPFPCRWLPAPGHYAVAEGRSIVELAGRAGPLTTLRARLALADSWLHVPDDASERAALGFVLDAASAPRRALRGPRGLYAERHPTVRFAARELESRDDDERFTARGTLTLRAKRFPALLRVRVVERTELSLLVLGTAALPYRPLHRATGFALPPTAPAAVLRLLFAAEFTA